MDSRIFRNSYVIMLITFILLCIGFYLFNLAPEYGIDVKTGKPVQKFSWKYPLAISLIVWIVWHFYMYPEPEENVSDQTHLVADQMQQNMNRSHQSIYATAPQLGGDALIIPEKNLPKRIEVANQKINMVNWY